jgi:hypothetical protein
MSGRWRHREISRRPATGRTGHGTRGGPTRRHEARGGAAALFTRLVGGVAVLLVGAVHLDAYRGAYRTVPTIGPLFLVAVVGAAMIGALLLLPLERAGRWGAAAVRLTAGAGFVLAATSLVMLVVSEHGTLFGFHEPGYDPTAISRSRVAEGAVIVLLGASLALGARSSRRPRW